MAESVPTEEFLARALGEAVASFGLAPTFTLAVRRSPGRTAFVVTLHPPAESSFALRRWRQVASALQALVEAALADDRAVAQVAEAEDVEEPGLVAAARALARRAVQLGRPFALGPMSAVERRLVHQALGDLPDVWTKSEGEGMFRRLWVLPRAMLSRGGRG